MIANSTVVGFAWEKYFLITFCIFYCGAAIMGRLDANTTQPGIVPSMLHRSLESGAIRIPFSRNAAMAEPREDHVSKTEAPSASQEGDTTLRSPQVELPPREPARVPPLHLSGTEAQTDACIPTQSPPSPMVPGYEILAELGHGGMGVVYQARQVSLGRMVALKMIRAGDLATPRELARFKSEAEAVARLKHPNIVQIYEVGECHGRPFFSLEYVE